MTNKTITDNIETLRRLSKPIGHHSWWYANRSSSECINVKIYAYNKYDINDYLSEADKKNIETLNIKIENFISEKWWDELSIAREELELMLQGHADDGHNFHDKVQGLEYTGRSGGWLCVQYDFTDEADTLEDIENDTELTEKQKQKKAKPIYKEVEAIITDTENKILKRKKQLEEYLKSEEYTKYLASEIQEFIKMKKEEIQDQLDQLEA